MFKFGAHLWVGAFLLVLGGCATTPQTRVFLETPPPFSRHIKLHEVPFFAQDEYQCGPATLAMALHSAGQQISPEQLRAEVYLPGRQGSLQIEMLASPRRHGIVSYQLAPRLDDLLSEVAAGTPVIVLQNLGLSWFPVWHYALVIGYDLDREEIILRSGREQRQVLPLSTFERTWARGEHWAMVVMPNGTIPLSAEEQAFVSAVSALEKSGHDAQARNSYAAVLQRWPTNLKAQMGLGNTAYHLKDFVQAESVFRQALKAHPESVAVLNNLAQVLADLGRDDEALMLARRAVDLGGPLNDAARETLSEIQRLSVTNK